MICPNASTRRAGALLAGLLLMLGGCSAKITAPPEPPATVRRGDDLFRYRDYEAAISSYRIYLDQTEKGDYTLRAFYKAALANYRLERYQETLNTLDELAHRFPSGRWVQIEALRGDAQREMGHPMMALRSWEKAWEIAGENDRQKLRQRIAVVGRQFNDVELAKASRFVRNPEVQKVLDQQIAARQPGGAWEPTQPAVDERRAADASARREQKAQRSTAPAPPRQEDESVAGAGPRRAPFFPAIGQPTDGAEAAEEPPRKPGTTAATPKTAARADDFEEDVMAPEMSAGARHSEEPIHGVGKIGCLLPMTGPAQDLGQRSVRGVRLAFGNDGSRLVLKDTRSDPAVAAQMFEELSRDPNVLAIIGPLHSDDAQAVAPRAEDARLPLLLLSQRDGLNGPFVLQAGMTRSSEVSALLDYAMDKVRMRRFGVLYPNDISGTEFLAAFQHEVERRGGQVIGAALYPPGTTSLTADAATVKTWRAKQDLQAVFLPDTAPAAAEFAAWLQREMPDVMLLGVHSWEGIAGRQDEGALNGVLFTDGFYSGSTRAATQKFIERFEQSYGETPGVLEAQGYDAGILTRRALGAGANSRADMLQRLHALGSVEGASGELLVTPAGVQRSLFLLQLYKGKVQEVGGNAG